MILNLIKLILARFILWILGWSIPDCDKINLIKRHERVIVIYSHSSLWDFMIFFFYKYAIPEALSHSRVFMRPQSFRWFGWFLYRIGAIRASPIEETGNKTVELVTKELNKEEKFFFLISPKGTRAKREWKSGFYYIARNLEVPIVVIGLDYYSKSIYVSPVTFFPQSYNTVEELDLLKDQIKEEMKNMTPLHPEREIYIPNRIDSPVTVIHPTNKVCLISVVTILFLHLIYYLFS